MIFPAKNLNGLNLIHTIIIAAAIGIFLIFRDQE
jgi:hypothetical protein